MSLVLGVIIGVVAPTLWLIVRKYRIEIRESLSEWWHCITDDEAWREWMHSHHSNS